MLSFVILLGPVSGIIVILGYITNLAARNKSFKNTICTHQRLAVLVHADFLSILSTVGYYLQEIVIELLLVQALEIEGEIGTCLKYLNVTTGLAVCLSVWKNTVRLEEELDRLTFIILAEWDISQLLDIV